MITKSDIIEKLNFFTRLTTISANVSVASKEKFSITYLFLGMNFLRYYIYLLKHLTHPSEILKHPHLH